MAYDLWAQDNFTKGELSPYMYARASVNAYYNGLKTAQNVLCYPTGAAGKRFGTLYQATLSGIATSDQLYFSVFQYLDECIYQLIFRASNIDIYLEGILIATVSTSLDSQNISTINSTTLASAFRVAGQGFKPYDLTRAPAGSGIAITGTSANLFTAAAASFAANLVLPVRFTTTGALPTTVPQIKAGITYFIYTFSTTTCSVYASAYDAKFNLNVFTLTNAGTGTNNIFIQNTWTWANCVFQNLPFYDFNSATTSYDNLTFTPNATTGITYVTISGAGYAPLDVSYVGGAFSTAHGTGRIIGVAQGSTDPVPTKFFISVQQPFDSVGAIQGSLCLLAEPAWSNARGWPQVCSSYQNRALFANTASLSNGFWASVINDYTDFGDLTTDDDDAISWFPSSNSVNSIRYIVPYRSITVHTNTGIYSSPLSDTGAITPKTFTLQLQDTTPADVLIPVAIDNQILILSGNDLHTQLWDGINNAYTGNIISIANEQTIRSPVDEAAYADLTRAGSRYVFVVNQNGTMATFQTLLAEEVGGITPQIPEQSYGAAYFRQVDSSSDGRAWFVMERELATAGPTIAITGYTSTTLTAIGTNIDVTAPIPIRFATAGTLPAATPALNITSYFWAIGITADTFRVYTTQDDAIAGTNALTFTSAGTSSTVTGWPFSQVFTLEELTHETYLDCAVYYTGSPTSTVTTGALFNAQDIKMVGDGYGFEAQGFNNQVTFSAHGSAVTVSEAYIGFPINTIIEPMPLSLSLTGNPKNTTLTKPKHIRTARFMFNDTIGGTINDVPIALEPFSLANIGSPPNPARGIFEVSVAKGWDDFNNPTFTIEHNEPFNIELLGVFYSVEF